MNASTFLSGTLQQSAQMSLVILLVALVAGMLCRRRPHWAYALWMLALLKCLTPPLWSSATSVFSWAEFLRATPAVVAPFDTHADAARAPLTAEQDRVSPANVDAERAEIAGVDVPPPKESPTWYGPWTISPQPYWQSGAWGSVSLRCAWPSRARSRAACCNGRCFLPVLIWKICHMTCPRGWACVAARALYCCPNPGAQRWSVCFILAS